MNGSVSKTVKIGGFDHVDAVTVGGGFPVVIQTMWKDRLSFSDLEGKAGEGIAARINGLKTMGCGLLRFAVPDLEAAEALGRLAGMVSMPLVADIHFDYKIALRCMDFPVAKIRINPGNIGGEKKVDAVLGRAAERGVPIRIGVNAGSLPLPLRQRLDEGSLDGAQALVLAAEEELALFEKRGFQNIVVSMKASSVAETIRANRLFAGRNSCPLHIGVTEAGPLLAGTVRNTAALIPLLAEGVGDTLRVSLSDSMENEVIAAREILNAAAEIAVAAPETPGNDIPPTAARLRRGIRIVSCPRCGRHAFDTHGFASRWMNRLYSLKGDFTVAIMGCAVNGPEEARHADIGITGAGDKVLIFSHGKIIQRLEAEEADTVFKEELEKLLGTALF